jgi:general secretion pathway protein G
MKRSGFTMIELIFVIVILGILAAVAIPKLAATRDDAKIAKGSSEVSTLINDVGAYYTAQGAFGAINLMTNVVVDGNTVAVDGNAEPSASATVVYQVDGTDCIDVEFTGDGNVTASNSTPVNTAAVCAGIRTVLNKNNVIDTKNVFGGSSVNW